MPKKKDEKIVELNLNNAKKWWGNCFTPIGMGIALIELMDKWLWYGVVKKAGELSLMFACYNAQFQEGLAEFIASILLDYHAGTLPEDKQLVTADLTSSQVAALAGYSDCMGATVVLNLDSGMIEYYVPDQTFLDSIPQRDSIFYNEEFYNCAYLTKKIMPRVKLEEHPINEE